MELNPLLANIMAVVAIISGIIIAAWWVIGLYWVHSRKTEEELPEIDMPSHLHEVLTGTPPFLIIFYIFIGISLVAYVLYIWIGGLNY
ncbi:MAG: hypothetical protein HYX78_02875 [Armatimonadetes bacterium]|nr:hypothetical protein [Armatimonadota bacterium]